MNGKLINLDIIKQNLSYQVANNRSFGRFHKKLYMTKYIVEELLLENGNLPNDYKLYVIDGVVKIIAVTYGRKFVNGKVKFNVTWFTRDWVMIPIPCLFYNYKYNYIKKPNKMEDSIRLCEKIMGDFNIDCRIDIYIVNNIIYFGEFTPFPGLGQHTIFGNILLGIL